MPESKIPVISRKYSDWFLMVLCGLVIVLIGWFREQYILNFFLSDAPLLIPRGKPNLESYPLGFGNFVQHIFSDPRWLTTIILNGGMMFCSAVIVGKWFGKRSYFWLVIAAYLLLSLICGMLVGFSLLFHDYSIGYGIAQQIKNLLQLPFLLILFIPVLSLYEKGMEL